MRATAKIFLIICLLFLVGTVGAVGIPDTLTVTTSISPIVANNVDQSEITIALSNTSSNPADAGPVTDVWVRLTVDPSFGALDPETVKTDEFGKAISTFTAKKLSGAPQITATTDDPAISPAVSGSVTQNIDPRVLSATYSPKTGTVGVEYPFMLSIRDQSGVPMSETDGDTTVSLSVSCPMPNDCEFVTADSKSIGHLYSAKPLNGDLEVVLKLGTRTGLTTIVMSPVQDLRQQVFTIDTKAATPPILTPNIIADPPTASESDYPTVPVGSGVFYISYRLADQFGNPVAYQPILIETSEGEQVTALTNTLGRTALYTYGPHGIAGNVVLTATVIDSIPSITNQTTIVFANIAPRMSLTVDPLSMGSHDYDEFAVAYVTVRVGDDFGNPITAPQDITLTLHSCSEGENWTGDPYLDTYGGQTTDGVFTTVFHPGSIEPLTYWQETCELTANWDSNPSSSPQTVTLTWSNRPYIDIAVRVEPVDSPAIVQDGMMDVEICVTANGKAGEGPLTIVIDQDSTQNLGRKNLDGTATMMEDAVFASKTFIDKLRPDKTQLGMETFGKEQDPVVGHLDIPTEFAVVKAELDKLEPLGPGTLYPTSLLDSISKIREATKPGSGHEDDVKVIVFLSDGGSILQDPEFNTIVALANGDGTEEQKIRIMTVCYTNNVNEPSGAVQMRALSAATGGTAYIARNAAELAVKFDDLFRLLMDLCGASSTMTVDFSDIEVTPGNYMPGSTVYEYIPYGIAATLLNDDIIADPDLLYSDARTRIIRPDGTQYYQNQASQWPDLSFAIGKIPLGKSWCTKFRLQVKQSGCYNAFGDGSVINLGVGNPAQPLPDLPICVSENVPSVGPKNGVLDVWDLKNVTPPLGSCYTDFISLQWNTKYNSSISTYFATETLSYSTDGGDTWKQVDAEIVPTKDPSSEPRLLNAMLDVRNLPSGSYDFKVYAYAEDAEDDTEPLDNICVDHGNGLKHINLT
jgi:hypothetical protein